MCFGGPHKGLGFFVTYGNIFMNGTDQFGDAAKYAVAQSRRSDVAEESLECSASHALTFGCLWVA